MPPVPVNIVTADGAVLGATWYPGSEASRKSVIALPAFAAPQYYLKHVSAWLQEQGWGVLTFDYRGIGASRAAAARGARPTLMDWAERDIPACVAWVRREIDPAFFAGLGHSMGGWLLPLSSAHEELDALVHVSVQSGDPRFWRGWERAVQLMVYYVYPVVARLVGYLPGDKLGLGHSVPKEAFLQWCRWGREGRYTDLRGESLEHRHAAVTCPILCYSFTDDTLYAPLGAVKAVHRLFTNAPIEYRHVRPDDYALERLSHFGFFKRPCRTALWPEMLAWLDAEAARAGRERKPAGL